LLFTLIIALIPSTDGGEESKITSSEPQDSEDLSDQSSQEPDDSGDHSSDGDMSSDPISYNGSSGSGSTSLPATSIPSASSSLNVPSPTAAPYIPVPTTSPTMLQKIAQRDLLFAAPPAFYRVTDLLAQIRLPIVEMQQKKMGGALASVNWGKDYLNNELSWIALNQDLERLTEADMVAWIWDEKGFPSGSAGGLAVEGRPDLEARGVFKLTAAGEGNVYKELLLPEGGEKFLSAVLYPVENGKVNFSKGTPAEFSDAKAFTNGQSGKWELWTAVEEILLEAGGSPSEAGKQFDTSGRTINLMNRDAVRRFIDVTYEKYKSKLNQFSDRITGFLAGEPNLQTIYAYTDNPRPNGRAYFAWDDSIPGIYKQRYGTDLAPLLPMMLGGDDEINKRLRYQYYTIVGDLVSENYSGQLTDWAESNGVFSSAFLFGQEYLSKHVWLQGNLMQVVGRFSVPIAEIGLCPIDRINIMDYSGIKYVASAARLAGKYNTMIYMDPLMGGYPANTGFSIDSNTLIANLNVYAHLGFSQTGTYGHYNTSDASNYAKYNEYAGRLNVILRDAIDRSQVALYYPIETFQGRSVPTAAFYHTAHIPYNDIETPQKDLFKALTGQNIDFNHIDARAILDSKIQNKTLVIGNYAYRVIVMPAVELIELDVVKKLNQFEAAGGKVIYYLTKPSIAGKVSDNNALKSAVSDKMIASNLTSVLPAVRDAIAQPVIIEANTMVMYSQFTKDTRHLIFIANKMGVAGSVTISVAHAKSARILNPENGQITNVTLPYTMNLGGYRGVFVEITG
jgi:hypothetical protein